MLNLLVTSQNKALVVNGAALVIDPEAIPTGYQELTGIKYDGNVFYETPLRLQGSDTVRFSFSASKACNVLGCYTSGDASNNYSLYITSTSTGKYLRYNGETYNSYFTTNTRYNVVVTPSGSIGMKTDSTWTAKTFTADNGMCIGTTSLGATSAKLTGTMFGKIIVDGKAIYIPVKRTSDNEIGYYDTVSRTFFENQGTGTPTALGYA